MSHARKPLRLQIRRLTRYLSGVIQASEESHVLLPSSGKYQLLVSELLAGRVCCLHPDNGLVLLGF